MARPSGCRSAQPLLFALQFLSPGELLSSASVCYKWCEGTRLCSLWRLIDLASSEGLDGMKVDTSSLNWIASSCPMFIAQLCWLQADC